jgi:ribosomal protein S18 acetylase RimI-like enzyme
LASSATLTVRRAGRADLPKLGELFDAYRQFYGRPSDREASRAFVEARMEAEESVVFLAVDEAGEAVGFTQLYPLFSSVRMVRIFVLNDLFVTPEARGRGAARALIAAAERFAKEEGAASLSLSTAHDNVAARSLYRAMGWTPEENFIVFNRQLDN